MGVEIMDNNNRKEKEQAIKNEIINILKAEEYKYMTGFFMEELITTIFEKNYSDMGKLYYRNYYFRGKKRLYCFDGFIPEGVGANSGATAVEIKIISEDKLRGVLIESFIKQIESYSEDISIVILLIVSTGTITDKLRLEKSVEKIKLKIWDIENIIPILLKYEDLFYELISLFKKNQFHQIIRAEKNGDEESFKKRIEKDIEIFINNIKDKINTGEVVLFLGAGVSKDAGLPLWNELLNRLYSEYIDNYIFESEIENKVSIEEEININDQLVQAEFLKLWNNNNDEQFKKDIHDVMYSKEKKEGSLLIESICKLLKAYQDKIKIIITYNFDDLLERFLSKHSINYKSVCDIHEIDSLNGEETGIIIYHVHGIIPKCLNGDARNGNIVFSEKEYYDSIMDIYKGSNVIQLNYLLRNTCLFIGMSMSDLNLKRLLLSTANQRDEKSKCTHYVIMCEKGLKSDLGLKNRVIMRLKKELYKIYNLNLIQVRDYVCIPCIIDKLY